MRTELQGFVFLVQKRGVLQELFFRSTREHSRRMLRRAVTKHSAKTLAVLTSLVKFTLAWWFQVLALCPKP